jgi:hypothetical protein
VAVPGTQAAAMCCFGSQLRYEGERKQRLRGILFYVSESLKRIFLTTKQLSSAVSTEIKLSLFDCFSKTPAKKVLSKLVRTPI